MGNNGDCLNAPLRQYLEGWDFKDMATFEDPLYPRVCQLGAKGKSWVDFTRSICAVTLFGRGFGEIIQPAMMDPGACEKWATLPGGTFNLAVCLSDLYNIADRFGNPRANPVRLTKNTIWYSSMYTMCRCADSTKLPESCELAQALLPIRYRKGMTQQKKDPGFTNWAAGAVVFGHNRHFSWLWRDKGPPISGDILSASEDSMSEPEDDDGFHDTGIGSSSNPPSADSHEHGIVAVPKDREVLSHDHYEVGIVCALWKELLAVRALFDNIHQELKTVNRDPNHYSLGRMQNYNVVAAGLPSNDYGTNSAANVSSHLIRSFPRIKVCLVVGVGGGVPSQTHDIRLGDVVVSTAVVQFDMGKAIQDAPLKMTGCIQSPPGFLMSAITGIRGDPLLYFDTDSSPLREHLDRIISLRPEYHRPPSSNDRLFESPYLHKDDNLSCEGCDGPLIIRPKRDYDGPNVHYGLIASGNQVVRNARFRDRLEKQIGVLCFEMEAAGVTSSFPCLVIRGICDYADSHKNKHWQEYASATAAAYAKFFLANFRIGDDIR
jgi:nucleoside phosphorylase